jgi:pimeloyl-ACP methyl ester carboxylesterase
MLIPTSVGQIHVSIRGTGIPVVLLPFLGRSVTDFNNLALVLADAGFQAIGIDLRGVGESRGPLKGLPPSSNGSAAARMSSGTHSATASPVAWLSIAPI